MLDVDNLQPGEKLGDYEIIKEIGRGGMGVVYLARHLYLKKRFALKILPSEYSESPDFTAIFQQEAQTLGNLKHPNVVEVHNFGVQDGAQYIVMEYVEGTSIQQYLEDDCGGKMPPQEVYATLYAVVSGVEHAHGKGIVHRDLKPDNFLLDSEGTVKITDFGLAQLMDVEYYQSDNRETKTKNTIFHLANEQAKGGTFTGGTEGFMAPEAAMGYAGDHRSDYYAIGVIAYYLLTGEIPKVNFKPASALIKGLDKRWDGFIDKCLQPEADDRFQSAPELFNHLKTLDKVSFNLNLWSKIGLSSALLGCLFVVLFFILGDNTPEEIPKAETSISEEPKKKEPKINTTPKPKPIEKPALPKPKQITKTKPTPPKIIKKTPPTTTPKTIKPAPKIEKPKAKPEPTINKSISPPISDAVDTVELTQAEWAYFAPSFSTNIELGHPTNYIFQTPTRWELKEEEGDNRLFLNTSDHEIISGGRPGEIAIAFSETFNDFKMKLQVKSNEIATTAIDSSDYTILFGYKNPDNYLMLQMSTFAYKGKSKTQLVRVINGERGKTLFNSPIRGIPDDEWHDIEIHRFSENIRVLLDGTEIINESNPAVITKGLIGIGSSHSSVYFDNISVENIETAELKLKVHSPEEEELSSNDFIVKVNGRSTPAITGTQSYRLPAGIYIKLEIFADNCATYTRTWDSILAKAKGELSIDLKPGTGSMYEVASNKQNTKNTSLRGKLNITVSTKIEKIIPSLTHAFNQQYPFIRISSKVGSASSSLSAFERKLSDLCIITEPGGQLSSLKSKNYNADLLLKAPLGIILNTRNTIRDLSPTQVHNIFKGKTTSWPDGESINVYTLNKYSSSYHIFKSIVIKKENSFASNSKMLNDTRAVISAVTRDQNGIGFIDTDLASTKIVNVATIQKTAYNSPNYPLALPLYLISRNGESEIIDAFIEFVLSPSGQDVIQRSGYTPIE